MRCRSHLTRSISKKRVRDERDSGSASDSDVCAPPRRTHKVLRSRVIGSDNEESCNEPAKNPIIELSDSTDKPSNKTRGRKPKGKTREVARLDTSINLDADLANLQFTPGLGRITNETVANKNADEIVGTTTDWLDDMELIRFKSKRMNGRLSGCLKERIVWVKSMVKILADRLKDTGDVSYLRRKNDELTSQLRESRREESRLQGFLKETDAKIEKMSAELFELRRKIGSTSVESEKFPPLPTKPKQGTPARTTPKQEKKVRRGPSVSETLKGCDEQLDAISRFDDKILHFEELLRKLRADLYGSVESVADRVNKICSGLPKAWSQDHQ